MKFVLILILALVGLGVGSGAGYFMRPSGDPSKPSIESMGAASEEPEEDGTSDYVKLNNQFVVPLVVNGDVSSLVVISLSLEVVAGTTQDVYEREPKIRDSFLQVMFDHANAGGFSGTFTQSTNMVVLRDSLLETARRVMGDIVKDVLIVDLIRQDT